MKIRSIAALPFLLLACDSYSSDCGITECSERSALDNEVNTAAAMLTCADGQVSDEQLTALRSLADTSTLSDIYDVEYRIDEIATRFGACEDPRGLFPTVYRPITIQAVSAIDAGAFEHDDWVRDLVVDFARRYLDNLALELDGTAPSWAWDRYYELAANDSVSRTRTAAMGIIVHLGVDLPHCLVEIDTQETHKEDFYLFGDILVEVSDVIIDDLMFYYGADSADLFNGFFLGSWVDGLFGSDTTTAFSFLTIRTKAWNNAWLMRQWWGGPIAAGEIASSFWFLDLTMQTLDGAGTI